RKKTTAWRSTWIDRSTTIPQEATLDISSPVSFDWIFWLLSWSRRQHLLYRCWRSSPVD
ncbi:hypothetical protein BHE74_00017505, partial [Ensete ventricosum]